MTFVLPPQGGRLLFEGRKATQFWLRTFGLEEEIEMVRRLIEDVPERKRAAVPIISEYVVDEKLKFIYIIQAQVDALGLQDGVGIIYWASPEREAEIRKHRDEHAEDIMRHMQIRGFDEMIEVERKEEK